MIDYDWLVLAVLFFLSSLFFIIRYFAIRKDFSISSIASVVVHCLSFFVFLFMAFKDFIC